MSSTSGCAKTHDTAASLIVVGSIALDTVSTPGMENRKGLGGSATYFSASSGLLCRPQVIAVLGEDFDRGELGFLVERGVDLSTVYTRKGKTFQWQGTYGEELGEATTLRTDLNVFADFEPHLNDAQKNCDFLFLANIIPKLQLKVVEQANAKFVAADTMNLWINTENADLRRVLSKINLLILNEAEAQLLSGKRSIVAAAHEIQSMGPRTVVIKRGVYGAFMLHEERIFLCPAYPTQKVVDPTGCGDTFAGGLMGTLARHGEVSDATLREGMIVGTALASFTIEGYSLDGLKQATVERLRERYAEIESLTKFGPLDM
ncbi:MAG: sugar kinase [Proteobacteria bacterium]|jgi:sugar/nucleoside kinase (ribokinase family)|nr:sugar kinase [Pseudomonadota bacterium]MBQ9817111.1 sugar kinase [Pseudomonadota bacterium]